MAFGDFARVNTNVQAFNALNQLSKTNQKLGEGQMRLSTGLRINKAEDDSAGYAIGKKLEAKTRGQAQALVNIGDSKSMLTVAEGSLNTTMDILQQMKEKAIQAGNDTLGASERKAIHGQLNALQAEITDTLDATTFNGKNLFSDDSKGTSFTFQVNAENGDTFKVGVNRMSGQALGVSSTNRGVSAFTNGDGLKNLTFGTSATSTNADKSYDFEISAISGATVTVKVSGSASTTLSFKAGSATAALSTKTYDNGLTLNFSAVTASKLKVGERFGATYDKLDLGISTNDQAGKSLSKIDTAISKVSSELGNIGDSQKRLTIKQDNLSTSMANYEAARSRIVDADFAKEQMQIVKMQILQQTGISSLAQANAAPQSVLSLL